jgi:hypothetical protein
VIDAAFKKYLESHPEARKHYKLHEGTKAIFQECRQKAEEALRGLDDDLALSASPKAKFK